jgi:phosphotransferase system  glucose/maltose/N-acetylglucosamine-specific IIC component
VAISYFFFFFFFFMFNEVETTGRMDADGRGLRGE